MVGRRRKFAWAVTLVLAATTGGTGTLGGPAAATPALPLAMLRVTVTSGADDGSPGTFRAALEGATSADAHEIVIDPAVTTITLDNCADGRPMMDSPGAGPLTIVGNGATIRQTCTGAGVFGSVSGIDIADVTITGGFAFDSGGGIVLGGPSVLTGVTVTGNVSAGVGGGIAGQQVTLVRSAVTQNRARFVGGGVSATSIAVDTSTLSDNAAPIGSGIGSHGAIDLRFATVVSNDEGPNLLVGRELTSFGSVVGLGSADCVFGPLGSSRSLGYNVVVDGSCRFTEPSDQMPVHPAVGPLGLHDGRTPNHLPRSGSLLIDAIPGDHPACTGTDQRGFARPERGACDIGSVEVRTPTTRGGTFTTAAGTPLVVDLRTLVDDPDEVLLTYVVGPPAHATLFLAPPSGSSGCFGYPDVIDPPPYVLNCRVSGPPAPHAALGGSLWPASLSVIRYEPDAGFAGSDSMALVLCDARDVICTEPATITVDVTAAPASPVPLEPRFTG